jgi:hypothetical protein
MPRSARVALLLTAAFALLALSMSVDAHASAAGVSRDAASELRADLEIAPARVMNDRREAGNAERSLKQRLALFAVFVAMLAGLPLERGGVAAAVAPRRIAINCWSTRRGRSPPLFSSSIA